MNTIKYKFMTVKFEKPLTQGYISCLNCGGTPIKLNLKTPIVAGFGTADITKNGKIVYSEAPNIEFEDAPRLSKFERMARKEPNADWRYKLNLPLRDAEYQRQGKNNWVLIKSGMGFA